MAARQAARPIPEEPVRATDLPDPPREPTPARRVGGTYVDGQLVVPPTMSDQAGTAPAAEAPPAPEKEPHARPT